MLNFGFDREDIPVCDINAPTPLMNDAALLRKQILERLSNDLIPTVSASGMGSTGLMIAAEPPFPSAFTGVRALPFEPLREADAQDIYPTGKRWLDIGMHCIRFPYVACILDGEADIRVGVTQKSLSNRAANIPGGYVLSLPKYSCLFIAPGVPFSDGTTPHWERPGIEQANSLILWVHFLPVGILCHTCSTQNGTHSSSYSLFVGEPSLSKMMEMILNEQSTRKNDYEGVVRAIWLAILLRLRAELTVSVPRLTDGLLSRFPEHAIRSCSRHSLSATVQRACEFIQLHLHESLSPDCIAAHVALTPTQLNRLFRENFNQSIMRYVALQRIEAAKLLLQNSQLSIGEIANLVGYAQASHFSQAFTGLESMAPNKYRQIYQPKKS